MNILIITESITGGGKERRLVELLKGLTTYHSLKIKLVCFKKIIQYYEIYNLKNLSIEWMESPLKKDPRIFFKLIKLCKEFRPHLIHSWGSMPSIYILPAVIWYRIPLINAMISNSICIPFTSTWYRKLITFPFSKVILANSWAGIKAYKVPSKKASVIYNGFNFNRLNKLRAPEVVRKYYGITTEFVVGMVAVFTNNKDYTTFIKAAEILSHSNLKITFVAVGDGTLYDYHKTLSKNMQLSNLLFTGRVINIEEIIQIFNIGVLLTNSRIAREGISNSILEYMALAIPVIASRGGGTEEVVRHGFSGYVIEPANASALAEKILYIVKHPKIADLMGHRGLEITKEKFSSEKMVKSTFELYQKVSN